MSHQIKQMNKQRRVGHGEQAHHTRRESQESLQVNSGGMKLAPPCSSKCGPRSRPGLGMCWHFPQLQQISGVSVDWGHQYK